MNLFIRQGDIIFEKIDKKEEGKEFVVECNDKVVAMGEATGHHHSFSKQANVQLFKKKKEGGGSQQQQEPELLVVNEPSILTHQEHLPILIPKGTYKIKREVEYNPFLGQLQKVRD